MGTRTYKALIRPHYFEYEDPEKAHNAAKQHLMGKYPMRLFRGYFDVAQDRLSVNLGGKVETDGIFSNAAGFDKDAETIHGLGEIFDYVTVGTFLPYHWNGNTWTNPEVPGSKRIVRLENEEAMLNCLGFPFIGSEYSAKNISAYTGNIPISVSLAVRPVEEPTQKLAVQQFTYLVKQLDSLIPAPVKILEPNFASPNTQGLAVFFELGLFEELIDAILQNVKSRDYLLFLKMPPHLDEKIRERNLDVTDRFLKKGGNGVTAINTIPTLDSRLTMGKGGKSGRPIYKTMLENVKDYKRQFGHRKIIVNAAGGIWPENIEEVVIGAGADTVQFFTSFVYEGPGIVREAKQELVRALNRYSYNSLRELPNHSYS